MVKVFLRNCYSGQVMCLNLDSRRHRFTLATSRSSQYLKELFLLHFSTSLPSPPRIPRSKAAAKVRILFHPPNFFKFFFKLFFPDPLVLPPSPRALSLESGCKDKANLSPFPNFLPVIFPFFSPATRNDMQDSSLPGDIFPPGEHPGRRGQTRPPEPEGGHPPGRPHREELERPSSELPRERTRHLPRRRQPRKPTQTGKPRIQGKTTRNNTTPPAYKPLYLPGYTSYNNK